jgi:hypothetical protein
MKDNVFIAPGGGHGTVFLLETAKILGYKVHLRPCAAFKGFHKTYWKLADYPEEREGNSRPNWKKRTGLDLETDKTINENLLMFIDQIQDTSVTLFSGKLCYHGQFLTMNRVKMVGIVRHPMHAYVSWMRNRHPEKARFHGGFGSDESIEWYSRLWSNVVQDLLDSGSPITRYEFMLEDAPKASAVLAKIASGRWHPRYNFNGLHKDAEWLLQELTANQFYEVYDKWDLRN